MSKLFISYSKRNVDYAQRLKTKLETEGFGVWIDEIIEPSDDWWRTIRQAIRDCVAFILIMTPEAENSHWVVQELSYALELKKPFFPLLRDGNPNLLDSDVWSRFASIQATDVRQGQLPLDSFYAKLRDRLSSTNNRVTVLPTISPAVLKSSTSLDLMPKPFDWIDIPAGKVTLGGSKIANGGYIKKATTFYVAAFSIAKYPLTNAQYKKFVEADGYKNPKWWTTDGWQAREKEGWVEPRYWTDEQLNKPDYPMVGVSWYESIAFCRWLSELTGENITLPTDQQWQWAAQGNTKWAYPYGETFDETRCNFNTKGTTAVTQYEGKDKGDSPFGVVDMSGNVWDWCLTKYEVHDNKIDGTGVHVLRGGSWGDFNADFLRVDFRSRSFPRNGGNFWGFRIARS